ncbi:sigma-70 family RNA polymerase sigma factor [soil metagenome]
MAREASDTELLARFLGGEEAAFNELMLRHEDRIFALTLRITGDRGDALEATQETFLSLWRRGASFRGGSELGTWLYRIGINAARDQLRKKKRFPDLLEDAEDELVGRPAAAGRAVDESVATRLDVARALASLSEDYREAVVMHDLGGIPYEEIASATGVALGTVKSRISRGRRLLAERLEQATEAPTSKDPR